MTFEEAFFKEDRKELKPWSTSYSYW
jgi:hypothetical protein